jgi:hypothetical protein
LAGCNAAHSHSWTRILQFHSRSWKVLLPLRHYIIMSLTSFLHWLLSKFGSMDVPSWYSFISGCIFAARLLGYGICRVLNVRWPLTTSFVNRHLIYPHIFPRNSFIGTATRFQVLIVSLYLVANTLIVVIGGPRAQMSSRASTMSIINLIPLLCGPRLSLVTTLAGISLRASIGSHQWFGRTAIAQMLLHTAISLTGSSPFTWTASNLNGAVVCFAPAPAPVRRRLMCCNRQALLSDSYFSSRFAL